MKKKFIPAAIALAGLLILSGCKKEQTQEGEAVQIYAVRTAPVTAGEIQDYIKLSGETITKINVDA